MARPFEDRRRAKGFDRYNIIDEQDLARAVAKRFKDKQAANIPPVVLGADSLS